MLAVVCACDIPRDPVYVRVEMISRNADCSEHVAWIGWSVGGDFLRGNFLGAEIKCKLVDKSKGGFWSSEGGTFFRNVVSRWRNVTSSITPQ
jgi:hypothetical protein